jgi:chondroitin AC lyase
MVAEKGEHALENVKWIHHDGMGYLFFEPAQLNLSNQPATGSWYSVNRQSTMSKEEISLDVFKLWMDHGQRVTNGKYAYVVVPAATVDQMAETKENRNIEVVSNTPDLQAVSHKRLNLHQCVFYKGGEVNLPGGLKLGCDSQGVVMVKTQNGRVVSVSAADPSRKLQKIHLTLSGEVILSGEPVNCTFDKTKNETSVAIGLPLGVYAGKSVTIN